MPITVDDVIYAPLAKKELDTAIDVSRRLYGNIDDRHNLHARDDYEKFNNVLMGEIAEMMVIKWLKYNNKYALSAVNKNSPNPDLGHDVYVKKKKDGSQKKCSIKSSLAYKYTIDTIIKKCKLATTPAERRDINIQVYFWLTLQPPEEKSRITVPSLRQSALICWFGKKELQKFDKYNREERPAPKDTLDSGHTMMELLDLLA